MNSVLKPSQVRFLFLRRRQLNLTWNSACLRMHSLVFGRFSCLLHSLSKISCFTARSREEETRNARRNSNRNPEWWGDYSQLVKIEKLEFLCISRYKLKLRFWLNLNTSVSCGTNSNPDFDLFWVCRWLQSPNYSGFRFAFRRAFRVSSSRERAVIHNNSLTSCQPVSS